MSGQSVFPRLEPLLPRVRKPVQYVGGEGNSTVKPWESAAVRWCLMYPDAYEVGLPNQGLQILYEVLNEQPDVLAERAYAVLPDLEALLREHGVPQFTVDAHRPVGDFDVLGVSFATELGYTNLLTALDLAGIPLRAADRADEHPLVIAGGHAAFNPEPVTDFIDAAVLGDGEQAVLDITDVIRAFRAAGSPGGRAELLARLARRRLVYVPAFFDVTYGEDGAIVAVTANRDDVPARPVKHTLSDLDSWPYPKTPLVPLAETVHERMSVEIFRGCTRGCRFCQAGMITRPVRERSIDTIGAMVDAGLSASGFSEVGLLSLSSADHSEIGEIATQLADRYEGTNTSLSLPSTRVDAFNVTLANEFSRNGRRSGLTFAPEGGSERLRKVINKMVSEEDLIRTVSTAYAQGWRQVKLYFMCGLPTETDEDVLGIAKLAREVIRAGRKASGHRDIRCTVSIGGFVPKSHTPFQWAGQASWEVTDHRLKLLRDTVRADREIARAVGFRYHDGRPGIIEGLLARGDRRVGRVIERVWREGGRFDGWSEHFSFERWERAAAAELEPLGVSLDWFTTRERPEREVLPWDHLDAGLDRDWLWSDWQDALRASELDDCRWTPCYDCGVCPTMGSQIEIGPTRRTLLPLTPVPSRPARAATGAATSASATAATATAATGQEKARAAAAP
ncbi:TIGR03960 family B12-binding radical SAM protein [Pseudofrankia sp. BMG5.37]|uniref:TIGR03960 family B12-binding radical SAM protein n=1 Tax=Pseudofrankia sp. BMG5.37 TaxID=3050035 RepID=UPI0028940A35|nr:TIGR03960 family B12-binding radical SAM protein [Pseudofrankia sp. BMG5.37]MDT3445377.1 TIGR03960 family B12-binding radical SAM protein [Pseudofrankia sp. BMG5.37]